VARGGGRSILLVAHLSPPSPLIAARRVQGLTKYLARLGHSVTVLTSAVSGDGEIEGAEKVIRTHDLMTSKLNWRRGHYEALTVGTSSYRPPSRLQSVVVPDVEMVSWLAFALRHALRITSHARFDCVVTTSPPESTHLLGQVLKKQRGVQWIAELRDGWIFEPPRPRWPLGAQRALAARLERNALAGANAVVAVTTPIVDDLRDRLGLRAELITNGFDPEETVAARSSDPLLDHGRHSFVHTGRIAVGGASVRPLLDALALLEDDPVAERLEVVLAGALSGDEHELLAGRKLIHAVGILEHSRTLELQSAADTLLVITEGARRRSVATGKLFEYLGTAKPILVLGEETEAARIVAETRSGRSTSANDPKAIATALRSFVEGRFDLAEQDVERYSYASIAETYADVLERVASSR
jgi:hypothetical protein